MKVTKLGLVLEIGESKYSLNGRMDSASAIKTANLGSIPVA